MMKPPSATLVLTRRDVKAVLTMDAAVPAIEAAFAAHGRGEAVMPPKVYLPLEAYEGDFRAMPSAVDGCAGLKWVNAHPRNPERFGLPTVMGLYILSDPETALPLAVMDATLLTAARTGAAAAVASRFLARRDARTIGFVGCGVQARYLLEAHRVVYPDLVPKMFDVDAEAARGFASKVGGKLVPVQEAASCDIVCTATPSRRPIVQREWVVPGSHINAMGADAPGKQELEGRILADARVFIDDFEQATESGEINVPLHNGELEVAALAGTLGQVVAGLKAGRVHDDDVTVFDSTGLAIQDLALARLIHRAARERGLGLEVDFVGDW